MALIIPKELETYPRKENIGTISREDKTILAVAIDAALREVYGYLGTYGRKRTFEATGSQRNALLLISVKDIAVWHFVDLYNVGTDLQPRQDRYERAAAWLQQAQKSDIKPNLPTIDEDGDRRPDTAGEYVYGSNSRRNQHL